MSPRAVHVMRLAERVRAMLAGLERHRRHVFISALRPVYMEPEMVPWSRRGTLFIRYRHGRKLTFLADTVMRV